MRGSWSRKSQSLVEYSVLLAIVGLAFIGMFTYMKRGLQGTVKTSCDQLGPQIQLINSGKTLYTRSIQAAIKTGSESTRVLRGGAQTRDFDSRETTVIDSWTE